MQSYHAEGSMNRQSFLITSQPFAQVNPMRERPTEVAIDMLTGRELSYSGIVKRLLDQCPPEPTIPSQSYTPADFLKRQKALLIDVTERTQIEAAGKILSSAELKEGIPSIIDQSTWDDLVLVSGSKQNPKASLASAIDRTETVLGRLFLFGRLARPTDRLDIIKDRQVVTKALLSRDYAALYSDLKGHLSSMKSHESHLLSFWNSRMQLPGRVDKHYFKYYPGFDSVANGNSLALTMNSTMETSKAVAAATFQAAAAIGMPLYALSLTGALGENAAGFLGSYVTHFASATGPLYKIASLVPSNIINGAMGLTAGGISYLSLGTTFQWLHADLTLEVMLHQKMLSVARYYRHMKSIYTALAARPELAAKLEHFDKLENFMQNKDLQSLFQALESRTFDSEAGYFYQRGNVLLPWRKLELQTTKDQFQKALTAIAEIDTFVSTAKLVEESQTSEGAQYCFPEFVPASEPPVVELTDYWHPIVGRTQAVVNSIKLGERAKTSNIIITGPNAGGKSTAMRAITSNIIEAQCGFPVPATKMITSIFNRVTSSMQTADSIGQQSLFQAQAAFAKQLTTQLKDPGTGNSFNALDELFNGTNAADGAALAYATAEDLGKAPNSITMFATHFQSVPDLAKKGNRFKNYKVSVDDRMVPSYKLEPGISTQRVAFEVAAQVGLSEDILAAARKQRDGFGERD